MHRNRSNTDAGTPLHVTRRIDELCDEFEATIKLCTDTRLDQYLDRIDPIWRRPLLEELIVLALDRLQEMGVLDPQKELLANNPLLRNELEGLIAEDATGTRTEIHDRTNSKATGLTIRCPHCQHAIKLIVDAPLLEIKCESCGDTFSLANDALDTRDAVAVTRIAHFELLERLGMGEFGTVWKARDTQLDRTVAVKIPRREKLDQISVEKFMREARAAAQLHHPNIVRTHEVGREKDTLYIVSEYIRGVPLSLVIADHRLEVRESVLILTKIASALEHAHNEGVIHRDIKPSNILIDDYGEPHLMDFGLAKRSENEITITTEGAILGTPAYMSPEQARGEAHRVDGRSDIYSLGVILFQLLTGDLPFRGSIQMLLHKVINDEPPGPRWLDGRLPRDLDTICLKCMEKDPSRRYARAGELESDLRRYLAGKPIAARSVGALGRALRWARRNMAVAGLLAAMITTLLVATAVSSYLSWQSAENAKRADREALAVTDTLYDSLLHQIRLTSQVREQGYGKKVRELVEQARQLPTARVDKDELRRQVVLTMGDFVADPPKVITPSKGEVTAICFGDNDGEIFAGLDNGQLLAFNAAGKVDRELKGSGSIVCSLAINAENDRLVAADKTGAIRVWHRTKQNWEVEREFQPADAPDWVSLSRHGDLAAWLKGSSLEIWNSETGTKLHTLPTLPDWSMRNGSFDASLEKLVGGYVNEQTDRVGWALWDLKTGERLHEIEMPSLGNTFGNDIALSEVDDRMAIGFDEALLVYDLKDFQRSRLSGFDSTKAVAFNPTNQSLAALNIRGRISVWNSATNRQLATLHHPASKTSLNSLSFSTDGRRLASSNADSIQIWDLTRADEKTVMAGHNGAIPCAAFHPQGQLLATGGKDDEVRFWNPFTGEFIKSLNLGEAVQTLAFSSDGRLLAAGTMGRQGAPHLRLIDMDAVEVIYETEPAMDQVYSLAWAETSDGRFLAGCGLHGVALWKVRSGPPVRLEVVLEQKRSWCLAAVFNPAARTMVYAQHVRQLIAWDVIAGRQMPLHAPDMLDGWHGLTFLPNGQSILYVSNTGVAEIWNVEEDRRVESIGEPSTFVSPHIALSPDGRWFSALTQPDTVSVWHTPTGEHMFSLRPETGTVWSLAWDPSGEHLAVGQSDGSLAVWHLPKIQRRLTQSSLQWQEED